MTKIKVTDKTKSQNILFGCLADYTFFKTMDGSTFMKLPIVFTKTNELRNAIVFSKNSFSYLINIPADTVVISYNEVEIVL